MKAILLTGGLYLVEHPLDAGAPPTLVRQATAHDWLVDCSYSMYDELPLVVKILCEQIDLIPEGDRLSAAYFSSEGGENDWFLLNHAINGPADREAAKALVRRKIRPYGTTCFSEVVSKIPGHVEDASVFGLPHSFAMLTDGKPVVSWGSREEMSRVTKYLRQIEPLVTAGLFVGFGQFYDRQNLIEMTKAVGGNFIHADSMPAFNMALQTLIQTGKTLEAKASVALPTPALLGLAFTVNSGQVNFYRTEGDVVNLATGKGAADRVFYLTYQIPKSAEIVALDRALDGDGAAVYASQALALRGDRQDLAIDIASAVGDTAVVEALDGALNNRERGEAEQLIFDAALYPARRFTRGRQPGQVPDPRKFCLIDLYTMLMNDDEARLFVKRLRYKRIGPPQKVDKTFPKFTDDEDATTPLNTLTWNKELLNLSVDCNIKGSVVLNDVRLKDGRLVRPEDVGLPRTFGSVRFAKRAVIKDGSPWVLDLPVSCSEASFAVLKREGLVHAAEEWAPGKALSLDLSGLKVVNRSLAEGATSAEELCRLYYQDLVYYGQLKALKAILAELDPEKKIGVKTQYSAEQVEVLALNGIDHAGRYSPPKKTGDATDFYMAHVFQMSAKGFSTSSFNPVGEIRDKLSKSQKLTKAEEMVHSGIIMFEGAAGGFDKLPGKVDTLAMKVDWLRQTIANVKAEQLALRGEIAKRKVALALNHRWFDEASSREQTKFVFDGVEYTIVLDERKEKF